MYKVIYKKNNGEIIERTRFTLPDTEVGESTSMGWLLLEIQYSHGDKFYSFKDYHILMELLRNNEE